jgi:pathogenesis-related protein 1
MRATILLVSLVIACSSGTPAPAGGGNPGPGDGPPAATSPEAKPASPAPQPKVAAGPGGALAGMLEAHNRFRSRHCVPPLSWSAELAADAQAWAEHITTQGCRLEHAPGVPEGENLAWVAPVGASDAAGIAQRWYDEHQQYDYGSGGFSMQTGHFTQLIWAATDRLGCGVGVCNGGNIWVCRYAPPGNVEGQYRDMVKPPCN